MALKMFENYDNMPDSYIPDNRVKFLVIKKIKEIIIGGRIRHEFILPFSYAEKCKWVEAYYKQSLNLVETVTPRNYMVIEEFEEAGIKKSKVIITLPKESTLKFNEFRSTYIQLKFYTWTGEVIYSNIDPIRVIKSLDGGAGGAPEDIWICSDTLYCDEFLMVGFGQTNVSP